MDYIYIRRNITGLKTAFEVNYWQHEWPHLSYILAHLPNVACNLVQSPFSGGYLLVWQFPQTCTILNIEMKMLILTLMQSGPVSFFRRISSAGAISSDLYHPKYWDENVNINAIWSSVLFQEISTGTRLAVTYRSLNIGIRRRINIWIHWKHQGVELLKMQWVSSGFFFKKLPC